MNAWQMYLLNMRQKSGSFGEAMPDDIQKKLSKDQQMKISQMKEEATRIK